MTAENIETKAEVRLQSPSQYILVLFQSWSHVIQMYTFDFFFILVLQKVETFIIRVVSIS